MERWDTLWAGGWTFCFDDGAFKPSTDSFPVSYTHLTLPTTPYV